MLCVFIAVALCGSELVVRNREINKISTCPKCDVMLFYNITNVEGNDNYLISNKNDMDGISVINFTNCDLSRNIMFKGDDKDKLLGSTVINIVNCSITNGFKSDPCAKKINFINCVFDLSTFTQPLMGDIMSFKNCKFVESLPPDTCGDAACKSDAPVASITTYSNCYFIKISKKDFATTDKANDVVIEFSNCEFDIKDVMQNGKKVMVGVDYLDGRSVNIALSNCFKGQSLYSDVFMFAKIGTCKSALNYINVQGNNVGFDVGVGYVYDEKDIDAKGPLLTNTYNIYCNWTTKIKSNSYFPKQTPNSTPHPEYKPDGSKKRSEVDNYRLMLLIVGIVGIVLLIIVVALVVVIAKKGKKSNKRYDRSD